MNANDTLSITERLDVVETLLNATLWGAYLENPEQRLEIATHLNAIIDASERHNSFSPNVMLELKRISDARAQIDNLPDQIRPFLRP